MRLAWVWKWRIVRKVVVAIAGFSVLAFGMVLIVLPAPAVLVIPLGLAILAKEYSWAGTLLEWLRSTARRTSLRMARIFRRLSPGHPPALMR